MAAVTISNLAEDQPMADSVIDISQFVEVIYSYRCKLCNLVFDGSDAATGHIIHAHLQEVSLIPGNSVSSVSALKQTLGQGTLANIETTPSVDGTPDVFPGVSVTGLQRIIDSCRSTSTHLADGADGSFFVKSSICEASVTAKSKQSVTGGLVVVEPSVGSAYQEHTDVQLNSNFHSNVLQSRAPRQERSGLREMRLNINGSEVWLSIPEGITLDSGGTTKTGHWVGTSVTTSTECTQADLREIIDKGQPLKLFENTVSCGSELETQSSSMASSLSLIQTLDGSRLDPGEPNTSKMNSESNQNEYFVCSKCNLGFVTLEESTQHVNQAHMETFTSMQASDEVVMPPNTVSIGTQAQMYKKPGRKRKVIPTGEVINLDADGNSNQPVVACDRVPVRKEEPVDNSAAINAVNMLGIARVDNEIGGPSKRRVRPPKALIEDYFISRRKHKKRQSPLESFSFSCEVKGCSAKFLKPESLSYHVASHAAVNDSGESAAFVCPECKTMFAAWKALRMHLWKVHTIDSDLFKCQAAAGSGLCQYRTDSLQKLELHQETHSDARPYCCHNCGKSFRQRNQLRNHELTHHDGKGMGQSSVGDRNKECHICKRVFANQKSLKKHIEIVHDKKKPFLCNTCGHESSRKAMLDLHLRTHTGEKPYRCDMCNYMASDHNTLRRHRMRHTGEKPYKCLYCSYSCIQAISLKTHLKNKHPGCEGIYLCDSCQYQTVNKQHWLNHLEDHRNNLINNEELGQNGTNTIHVVVTPDPGEIGDRNQEVCVDEQMESVMTTTDQKLSVPMLSGDSVRNVSTQPSYSVVDFASQSYLEPVMMQVQGSAGEMIELKNVVTTLDGRVFHGGETVGQQVVQLTRSHDGFYVIMNEQSHSLMAPVQTADGRALYQSAVGQLNNDMFLQQTTVTLGGASALKLTDGSLCRDPAAVVYTTASSDQIESGGLHHILTAISAQQEHKLKASIEADQEHA